MTRVATLDVRDEFLKNSSVNHKCVELVGSWEPMVMNYDRSITESCESLARKEFLSDYWDVADDDNDESIIGDNSNLD